MLNALYANKAKIRILRAPPSFANVKLVMFSKLTVFPHRSLFAVSARSNVHQTKSYFSVNKHPVELHDNHLRVYFPGFKRFLFRIWFCLDTKTHSDYHYIWLRHNCSCTPYCRHPKTNEQLVDSSEISPSITPKNVTIHLMPCKHLRWNLTLI